MNHQNFNLKSKNISTPQGDSVVSYVVCQPLEESGFVNVFSTRVGGVSPLPREALNLAFHNDTSENVLENRKRFLQVTDLESRCVVTAKQSHSDKHYVVTPIQEVKASEPECDALASQMDGVLLGVKTADCLPILIGDRKNGTCVAIHAGWKGTRQRIVEKTVRDLVEKQILSVKDSVVALGPSACAQCYEVGDDVISEFRTDFPDWNDYFSQSSPDGKSKLNVRRANIKQLLACGFDSNQIFEAPYCTIHHNHLFFSYRVDKEKVGRLLSVIGKS